MDSFEGISLTEALQSHAGFLHALAAGLLPGKADAEDVVQQTWITALEHPPADSGSLRGWLKRVATNRALDHRRAEVRRSTREQWAARDEGLPSAAEIVQREELRRNVIQAVLDLAEPYRTALLLRYYEGLPPRLVARRLGVPVETARTRLKRGLAQLRSALDGRYGNRGAWAGVLLPLTRSAEGGPWSGRGGPVTGFRPSWLPGGAVAGLVLLGLTLLVVLAAPVSERIGVEFSRVSGADGGAESEPLLASDAVDPARAPVASGRGALELRLVRAGDREPVGSARVELARASDAPVVAFSDERGIALLPAPEAGHAELVVAGTARTLGWSGAIDLARDPTRVEGSTWLEVEVPAASQARGTVLGPDGLPRAGAEVLAFPRLAPLLQDGEPVGALASTSTDPSGCFAIGGLPSEFALLARTEELLGRDCFVAQLGRPQDVEGIELLLGRSAEVRGLVRTSDRVPLPGASVSIRAASAMVCAHGATHPDSLYRPTLGCTTRTDGDGAFTARFPYGLHAEVEVEMPGFPKGKRIWSPHELGDGSFFEIVLAEGLVHELRILTREGSAIDAPAARIHCDALGVLTLTGDSLGRIVLPPLERGTRVLARITAPGFGMRFCPPICIGDEPRILDVQLLPGESIEGTVCDASGEPHSGVRVGAQLVARPESPWSGAFESNPNELARTSATRTDGRGRFVLEDLASGEYLVAALLPGAGVPEALEEARAGDHDVRLVLEARPRPEVRIELRVIDAFEQTPITRFGLRLEHDGSPGIARAIESRDGRFELPWLGAGWMRMVVFAEGFAPWTHVIADGISEQATIEARLLPARSLDVQVVDAGARPVDSGTIRCLGPDRAPLPILVGSRLWLDSVLLRSNGRAQLQGLPAGPLVLEVSHPCFSERAEFEFDLTRLPEGRQILTLPWNAPANARTIALLLHTGASSQLTRIDQLLPASPAPVEFPPGARARVQVRDSRGGRVSELEWEFRGGAWQRSGQRGVTATSFSPSGIQDVRVERPAASVLAVDLDHALEASRLPRSGLLLDAPGEACELRVSIEGCHDAVWRMTPAVDDGRSLEVYEAVVVEHD